MKTPDGAVASAHDKDRIRSDRRREIRARLRQLDLEADHQPAAGKDH